MQKIRQDQDTLPRTIGEAPSAIRGMALRSLEFPSLSARQSKLDIK